MAFHSCSLAFGGYCSFFFFVQIEPNTAKIKTVMKKKVDFNTFLNILQFDILNVTYDQIFDTHGISTNSRR